MKLLVRLPNHVGDVLMATVAVRHLLALAPRAEVLLVGRPGLLELFHGWPVQTVPLPGGSSLERVFRTAELLRTLDIAGVALLAPSLRSALEASLGRVPVRVGAAGDWRRALLTRAVLPERATAGHRVEHYLAIMEALVEALPVSEGTGGGSATAAGVVRPMSLPSLSVPAVVKRSAEQAWGALALEDGVPVVAVQAFTRGGATRTWPLETWAELLRRLKQRIPVQLVVLGGPEEGDVAHALARQAGVDRVLAGASCLTLLEWAAVAHRVDLMLTVDTGPMHVAAAMGTRLQVVYASTLPERTGPWRTDHTVSRVEGLDCAGCYRVRCNRALECLTHLSLDAVVEQTVTTLKSSLEAP